MRLTDVLALLAAVTLGAQERRAADAILGSAGRPIELEVPVGTGTFRVIQQVLDAARVPYGVEQAPESRASSPIDLASQPARTLALDGSSVREALNAIVREDPRYEWSEANGRVLVRAASARGTSALDARVERFAVRDVSYMEALGALVRGMDATRPQPTGGSVGMSMDADRAPPSAKRPAGGHDRRITVTLARTTVLVVLEAIASAHGGLSWLVRYDDGESGFDHATIFMMGAGSLAMASSARAAIATARARDRLIVPVRRSLGMMLALYSRHARVHTGVELLEAATLDPIVDASPLDLTDLPPDIAVSRMVALDSRYEWQDAGGMLNIRPRPDHGARPSWLDQRFDSFSVSDATVEGVLDAIAQLLGAGASGSGSSESGVPGLDAHEQRRRSVEGRARRIGLTLGNVTLREILNAICRTHGTLSWQVRPQPSRGAARAYAIEFESFDGWSTTRTLTLP
jgi:hypothetical protein